MRFRALFLFLAFSVAYSPSAISAGEPSASVTQPPTQPAPLSDRSTPTILESYAQAWRGEVEFKLRSPMTLGIWVDGEGFSVELTNQGGTFSEGAPSRFDWGFETDRATLLRLDDGSLNALTAMGQARASDLIPLRSRLPEGFTGGADIGSYYVPLTRHFWDRKWPETIYFGEGTTRFIHGANATALIYDDRLRTAWYQLKPGMHINEDPLDQVNDFDTAIMVTRGQFSGELDGVERRFNEGEMILVPKGMTHEFFANEEEYGEFIVLMWGENA